MARNKIGLEFRGFKEYIAKLDELGGSDAMKRGVESALKECKAYINPKVDSLMVPSNMPSGGSYWTGDTKKSLDKNMNVEWDGLTGSIKVGFDFKKSGLTSIVLMHGTPKMNPVRGLKAAIFGTKTKREIAKIEEEVLTKVIQRVMEG